MVNTLCIPVSKEFSFNFDRRFVRKDDQTQMYSMLLFWLAGVVILLVCYCLAILITFKARFTGEKKSYLRGLITNTICFVFFLIYGLEDNVGPDTFTFLAPLWYLMFPGSLIFMLFFLVLFLTKKNVKKVK